MLNIVQITNSSLVVYTVPDNTVMILNVDVFPLVSPSLVSVKINDYVYWQGQISDMLSLDFTLTGGDSITIEVSGSVNVFVHGRSV